MSKKLHLCAVWLFFVGLVSGGCLPGLRAMQRESLVKTRGENKTLSVLVKRAREIGKKTLEKAGSDPIVVVLPIALLLSTALGNGVDGANVLCAGALLQEIVMNLLRLLSSSEGGILDDKVSEGFGEDYENQEHEKSYFDSRLYKSYMRKIGVGIGKILGAVAGNKGLVLLLGIIPFVETKCRAYELVCSFGPAQCVIRIIEYIRESHTEPFRFYNQRGPYTLELSEEACLKEYPNCNIGPTYLNGQRIEYDLWPSACSACGELDLAAILNDISSGSQHDHHHALSETTKGVIAFAAISSIVVICGGCCLLMRYSGASRRGRSNRLADGQSGVSSTRFS